VLRILSAALFGVITHVIKKLGPAVFVFVYIYLSHVWAEHPVMVAGLAFSSNTLLVAGVVLLSIVSVIFRSAVLNAGKRLDARALPLLDHAVLARLHHYDLRVPRIRAKSVAVLGAMKNVSLYVALAALASINSLWLAMLLLMIVVLVCLMCLRDWNTGHLAAWPHLALLLDPENLAEIILIMGLLLGFLVILPKGGVLLSGTVVILVIARFSGQIKALAKELNYVRRGTVAARTQSTSTFRRIPRKPQSPAQKKKA
jgi:hypothetical protein